MVKSVKREVTFGDSRFDLYFEKEFVDALLHASQQGVQILAYDSIVKENELVLDQPLFLVLQG
jgi:DNA-binding sugar fermentation-stimulating protein